MFSPVKPNFIVWLRSKFVNNLSGIVKQNLRRTNKKFVKLLMSCFRKIVILIPSVLLSD